MSRFLRKDSPFGRHFVSAFSPSTFQHLLCVQTQWFSMRYAHWNASNVHSFTVSYLIDTCGFSPQEAAAASKYVSFESPEKPDLVINFLKTQGLSQPQIRRFIKHDPEFLRSNPEKTFLPKIEFLKSKGVLSSHIPKLIDRCPKIMRASLRKRLMPSFDFFRDLFQSDDKLIKTLTYCSAILVDINTRVVPNMKLLREAGVPESNVIKMLQHYPKTLTNYTGQFKEIVEKVKELGLDPLKFHFVMAVRVCLSLSKSTWAKKADVYRKWGWSENDILAAFKTQPTCMMLSKDKIDVAMGFLVHELGCDSSTISIYPTVLGYSLKKRLIPRGALIQVLLSKGLVKKKTFLAIYAYNEKDFLRRHVFCHGQEASELLELYHAKLDLAR